jgi:hypothetical protein
VGTVTEIADHLRLLFARVGHPVCFQCGREIAAQTVQQVVDRLVALPADARLFLYAPVVRDRKGEHKKELDELRRGGFVRVRVDGALHDLADDLVLVRTARHTIEVLVDRLVVRSGVERRLADSIEVAFRDGGGSVLVEASAPGASEPQALFFSERHACPICGVCIPRSRRASSFNSPHGVYLRRSRRAAPPRPALVVQPQALPAEVRIDRAEPFPAWRRFGHARRPLPVPSRRALRRPPRKRGTRSSTIGRRGDRVPRKRRQGRKRSPASSAARATAAGHHHLIRDEIGAGGGGTLPDLRGHQAQAGSRFILVGGRIAEVSALSIRDALRSGRPRAGRRRPRSPGRS